jgi:diguanylate cyclase (GGDEF)-like protein
MSSLHDLACLVMDEMELRQLAMTDGLTGLLTRGHFIREADQAFALARRHDRGLSCIMMDVDFFKRVNDTHGHAMGDRVLRGVASACVALVRETDLVGRLGGEEFAIVLPETDLSGALILAERLRASIAETVWTTPDTATFFVTASLGVAEMNGADETFETALARADAAAYAAKRAGRNRVMAAKSTI